MTLRLAVLGLLPGLLVYFLVQRDSWEHSWPKIGVVLDNRHSVRDHLLFRVRCTLVNFLLVMVLVVQVVILLGRLDRAAQNHPDNGPLGGVWYARFNTRLTG